MGVKTFLSCLLLCLAYANTYAQQPITISSSVMNQNGQPLQGGDGSTNQNNKASLHQQSCET